MDLERLAQDVAAVVAIPVTPFDEDGTVDQRALVTVLDRLLGGGIGVVVPNGNTGEFYALTAAEARSIAELTMRTVDSRATVVVGVGGSVPDAVEAARHARDIGAAGIMVHQPLHPYSSPAGWVDYHRAIADAVPDLGVLLYLRDARIDGEHVAELGALAPNVVGVKYAIADTMRFACVARDAGLERFVWLAGLAERYAPAYWTLGARGFTSGLANVHPELSVRMLNALRDGDNAAAMRAWEQTRVFEQLRAANSSENNVSVVKEALAQLDVCRRDVRPPSHVVDPTIRRRISDVLASWQLTGAVSGAGAAR